MTTANVRKGSVGRVGAQAESAVDSARPPLPKRPPASGKTEALVPDELTGAQLHELKQKLVTRRAALVQAIEERRAAEREPGRDVGDEMDEANIEGDVGMTSKLLERDVLLLAEIDRALAKLRDGTYGTCEGTGEPIGYDRLSLQPWARYSVAYQEALERESRARGI